MTFEKIIAALRTYDTTLKECEKVKKAAYATVQANYVGGMKEQKISEVETAFSNSTGEAKAAVYAVVDSEVEAANKAIQEVAGGEMPSDLPASLASIEAMGANIGKYEASTIAEKYKENYFAFKAVVATCQKNGKMKDIAVLSPDAAFKAVNDAREAVQQFVSGYGSNTLLDGLFLDEKKNPFLQYGEIVDKFLNKEFTLKAE